MDLAATVVPNVGRVREQLDRELAELDLDATLDGPRLAAQAQLVARYVDNPHGTLAGLVAASKELDRLLTRLRSTARGKATTSTNARERRDEKRRRALRSYDKNGGPT